MPRTKKDTKNTADVGFEKQLWDAADVLRGNLDAAEYKNVVLGLIFLKYLSDRFDERYQELVAEGYGDEEDRDCYMEQKRLLRARRGALGEYRPSRTYA